MVTMSLPKLKQIFFDCDNTLVQTETLAFCQTGGLVNELMDMKGIEERYVGEKLIIDYIGLTFKQMLPLLAEKHEFELTADDIKYMVKREEEEVIKAVQNDTVVCKGVEDVLKTLTAEGKYAIAVVSSSSMARITTTLEAANLLRFFDVIYSAQTSLPVPTGKPKPDVYLHAMKELGLEPEECLSIEDSRTGMTAAHGAGVPCIGYVGCYTGKVKQEQLELDFGIMRAVTTMYEWSEFPEILEKLTSS